jgi:hypothetical protein
MNEPQKNIKAADDIKNLAGIDLKWDVLKQSQGLDKHMPKIQSNTSHSILGSIMDKVHQMEDSACASMHSVKDKMMGKAEAFKANTMEAKQTANLVEAEYPDPPLTGDEQHDQIIIGVGEMDKPQGQTHLAVPEDDSIPIGTLKEG